MGKSRQKAATSGRDKEKGWHDRSLKAEVISRSWDPNMLVRGSQSHSEDTSPSREKAEDEARNILAR